VNGSVLSSTLCLPVAQPLNNIFRDIASRMDRAIIFLRRAIQEEDDSLIDGVAAQEMNEAARICEEQLLPEIERLSEDFGL